MKILIADDDPVSLVRLSHMLEGLGHTVVTARDGSVAWWHVRSNVPDVIISDWMMPGLDGPELCRRVRAMGSDHYVYFILLTGREAREDRLEGLHAGADDFLTKPLDDAELLARLGVAQRNMALQAALREKARMLEQLSHELARMNEYLAEQATTDPLTGLSNRRHFEERLRSLADQANRHGRPLALALADIDHFKRYNDDFGHPAGDEALRIVSRSLHVGLRTHDHVARYGGEEFAILLPDAEPECAREIVERLRVSVAETSWPLRQVTISAGVAGFAPGVPPAELLHRADQALYTAKRRGRNCVVQYDEWSAMTEPARAC